MSAVFKEMGFYSDPKAIGWTGWIKTKAGTYFIDNDGKIVLPAADKETKLRPVIKSPSKKPVAGKTATAAAIPAKAVPTKKAKGKK